MTLAATFCYAYVYEHVNGLVSGISMALQVSDSTALYASLPGKTRTLVMAGHLLLQDSIVMLGCMLSHSSAFLTNMNSDTAQRRVTCYEGVRKKLLGAARMNHWASPADSVSGHLCSRRCCSCL